MTETAIIEKARKPKAIQEAPVHVTRSVFRFWDPSGFSPEQWRLISREPVNKMAQQFIKRELAALDFEIVSERHDDPRVGEYKARWDDIFEDGDGFYLWLFRILDDTMTLTFGGGSEISRSDDRLDWVQHVDAATLLPTYDKRQPYVQVNPDNWVDRIYFRKGDLARLRYGPRPEIHYKEWQLSPTEEALLPIEALSKIYLYYMQELTDTPAMGILDVMDMTYEEVTKWSKDFREMMQGSDPLKIPILYEHTVPAKWIPFNRSPADLNIPDLFKRFAEILLGKYGLSIGDLRLFEHESTKAGERVSQMVTERSGVGYWAALIAKHITRLLPSGLTFKFKQPRPEREKIVAERKLTQLAMLQAAAGQKQLISVEDAVEEATALEIFNTQVTPKEEKEQEDIFGPMGGQDGGKPPQFGNPTQEETDQKEDTDLAKSLVDVRDFVTKALTQGWRHPEPPAGERLGALMRVSFAKSAQKADKEQIEDIEELIRTSLEVLGPDAEVKAEAQPSNGRLEDNPYPFESADPLEKGGPGSGNWAHAGRPGKRGGSAGGGGLAAIGGKQAHTRAERQALSRKKTGKTGWIGGKPPSAATMTATVRARQAATRAAAAGRAARVSASTAEGHETEAFGQDPNKKYAFKMKVVELDSLVASNKTSGEINPDYDQTLQPRIRDRAASELQIDNMARNLQPEALTWDFHQLDKGAPIIGGDRMVESGNGRTLALQRARDNYPEQWDDYQKSLQDNLETHGIDPADVSGMRNPVLVRERITDVDRAEFAQEANQAAVLQMSPLEKAKSDQRLITDASMNNLTVGEGQSVDQALRSSANAGFVKTFVGALPPNEAAGIMRGDGTLNRMGLWRVKAAMFSKTFPGDAGDRLADTFFESVDHTTRNFENAMGDSLPRLARAEALITSGQRSADLSLATDISKAIDMHARLKESGLSARDYVAQGSLWAKELNGTQERLLVSFADNSRSRSGIRNMLNTYADTIINAPNPDQGTLFAGAGVTQQDVLNAMLGAPVGKSDAIDQAMDIVAKMLEKGGPTSGNWAHAGNPPHRGGSAAGGGLAAIGVRSGHSAHDKLGIVTARRREVGTKVKMPAVRTKAKWQAHKAKEKAADAAYANKQARRKAQEEAERTGKGIRTGAEARKQLLEEAPQRQIKVDAAHNAYQGKRIAVEAATKHLQMNANERFHYETIDGRRTLASHWEATGGNSQKAIDNLAADLVSLQAEKTQAFDAWSQEKTEYKDWMRGMVAANDPIQVPVKYASRGVAGARKDVWDEGQRSFSRLVSQEVFVDGMGMEFKKGGSGRSQYTDHNRTVSLTTTANAGVVVHEMGHGLEGQSPLVRNNAFNFFNYRTQGQTMERMSTLTGLGYRASEKAIPDKFMHPYMGKVYQVGRGSRAIRATEIISMGLEEMHRDAATFARKDPQMFDFVYDTVRGRRWSAPNEG